MSHRDISPGPSSVVVKKSSKDIVISLILTESTASMINIKSPYLEDLHPNVSKICIVGSECNVSLRNDSLSSEIGYFQVDSCASSVNRELSNANAVQSEDGSLPYILNPKRIRTRPMVTVRSVAHDDRLDVSLNKIYISIRNDPANCDEYFCRICHGGESIDDLLTPCRCKGTVALVHLSCLERWLLESSRSYCELCMHRFQIIKEPKYSILKSIVYFLKNPGPHWRDLLLDSVAFVAYTPTAIASTYMLMVLCESIAKSGIAKEKAFTTHLVAFTAVVGIAVIDFTYTSWLMICLQKHYENWVAWNIKNSTLKVLLPNVKRKPVRKKAVAK